MKYLVAAFYGLGGIVFLILLIYVIVKRLEERNKENFEKRKN
jgi:uncharacterized membrane protein YkvI